MSLKEVKVRTPDVKQGMYISNLDRPWLETPYLLQGFYIDSQDDINELLKYCEYVFVDVQLSKVDEDEAPEYAEQSSASDEEKQFLTNIKPIRYADDVELEEELKTASESHDLLTNTTQSIMAAIASNEKLNLPSLKQAVNPMIDSIIRNPDAFTWLSWIKSKDNYTYNHCLRASVWAVAFGRHLGLKKEDLQTLAIGALLFDSGKMKLPQKLIDNPNRFNQYEFKLIKQHVNYSTEIVKSIEGVSDAVINMVQTHHERHNGSGYPKGLEDEAIPIFGKIAGIVDCYDAITSNRTFAPAISPHEAVKKLYEWRDVDFQAELVEQFMQVVGIYPVGTLVELSDGRVGVIVAHHKVWRLRPKIMLLLNQKKESYDDFEIINLFTEITGTDKQPLNIIKSLQPGAYGIDPEMFYL